MPTRLIQFVGRDPETPSKATLSDGRKIKKGDIIEVDIREARELLHAPGQDTDATVDWIPVARKES